MELMNNNTTDGGSDNALVNTFNYGKTEHTLFGYIEVEKDGYNRVTIDSATKYKPLTPIQIQIYQYSKLIKYIDMYRNKFSRFITEDELRMDVDGDADIVYIITKYKINKSFLSYVIQNKSKLVEEYNENNGYQYNVVGVVLSPSITLNLNKHNDKLTDGEYDITLQKTKNHKPFRFNKHLVIKDNKILIDNREHVIKHNVGCDNFTYRLYEKVRKQKYNSEIYDNFIDELKKFFQNVNVSNEDGFDKYMTKITGEQLRMDNTNFVDELNFKIEEKRKKILERYDK